MSARPTTKLSSVFQESLGTDKIRIKPEIIPDDNIFRKVINNLPEDRNIV